MTITNPEFHDCECGHRWRHGQSGAHDCGPYYRQTIRHLRDAADAAPQVVADERAVFEAWITAAFDECGEDEPNLTLDENERYTNDMRVLASWQVWQARAALAAASVPTQAVPELFAEKLAREMREGTAVFVSTEAAPVQAPMSVQSAFEKATSGCVFGDASRLDAAQDWFKQGYIAAAPVQVQEPFMYGIMGPDGKAHLDENCVGPDPESLYAELNGLNDDPAAGYSIVKLFTAPVQPVAMPDDCKYQISLPINGESRWYDIPKNGYDMAEPALRRIVYAAPAAQGDANKDKFFDGVFGSLIAIAPYSQHGDLHHDAIVRWVGEERLYSAAEPVDVRCAGLDPNVYAAIAAKAAS